MSPGGRRLRPLAVLCALLLVAWGAASAGSLVAQVKDWNDILDAVDNFDSLDGQYVLSLWLFILAASSGCWVALWGLFGLGWRPPLHLGILALVVAVGLEIAANVVQANYISDLTGSGSFGDQLQSYLDRVTFSADGIPARLEARAFFEALPLVTAVLPLLCWMAVLVTGAGTKRTAYAYGAPYPQAAYPQAPVYYAPPPQPVYQPAPYPPHYPQPAPQPVQQAWPQPPPAYQPPPQPAPEPPPAPQPRVAWQDVPPVVPRQRPAPPQPQAPEQPETLPYRPGSEGP